MHSLTPELTQYMISTLVVCGLVWLLGYRFASSLSRLTYRLDGWLGQKQRYWILIGLLGFFSFLYYAAIRYFLLSNYRLGMWDFGGYDSMVWKIAHAQSPEVLFLGLPHWLGDHFQPILYLVVPFYWVWSSPHTLLLFELVVVLSALYPLTKLTYKLTHSPLLALTLGVCYSFSPGIYYALLYPMHPSTLIAPLLLWLFYCFFAQRWWGYALSALLLLMTKEDAGIYLLFIGLWQAVFTKERRVGLLTVLGGGLWSYLAWFSWMPYFRASSTAPNYWLDKQLYDSSGSLLHSALHQPLQFWKVATDIPEKWIILLTPFLGFAFLPLLSNGFWVLVPFLAERVFTGQRGVTINVFHYGSPVVAVAIFLVLMLISRHAAKRPWIIPVTCLTLLYGLLATHQLLHTQPIDLGQEYRTSRSEHIHQLNMAVQQVPADAKLLVVNGAAPKLAERAKCSVYVAGYNAGFNYVFIDTAISYWPHPESLINETIDQLNREVGLGRWSIVYQQGTTWLWKSNQ